MRRSATIRRRGFTLIELIVVIGIIVILAGLLLSAIGKFRDVGPQVQTKAEIGELGLAIESFKSTYQVDYVPPALLLTSNYAPAYAMPMTADELNTNKSIADSLAYLKKVWPKGAWTSPAPISPLPAGTYIPLDGNQVLVFLLGGIPPTDSRFPAPWNGKRLGFHNSPSDPFNKSGVGGSTPYGTPAADFTKPPFFDFKVDRLDANGHYLDPYGWPYYYFSSKKGNDYNYFGMYKPILNSTNDPYGYNIAGGYGGIGPPTNTIPAMNPFVGLDGKYFNPNGFQIISAGKDKLPGPGGNYEAGIGEYGPAARGGNDISNFHKGMLGSE